MRTLLADHDRELDMIRARSPQVHLDEVRILAPGIAVSVPEGFGVVPIPGVGVMLDGLPVPIPGVGVGLGAIPPVPIPGAGAKPVPPPPVPGGRSASASSTCARPVLALPKRSSAAKVTAILRCIIGSRPALGCPAIDCCGVFCVKNGGRSRPKSKEVRAPQTMPETSNTVHVACQRTEKRQPA
jgi:hypothetical protein